MNREEWWELIDLGFDGNANATKMLAYARSMMAHFMGGEYVPDDPLVRRNVE